MSFKIKVLNQKNDSQATISAFESLADYEVRFKLLAQVIRSEQLSLRSGNAHAKVRGEVRGGGKKPWKQKGTGRARHGSTRSPIWVGGGVVFGPRSKTNWHRDINKSARIAAIKSILKDRLTSARIYTLQGKFSFQKTKEATQILSVLAETSKVKNKTSILVYTAEDKPNISGFLNTEIKMLNSQNIKVFRLANAEALLITPNAIASLENKISQKSTK